MWAYFWILYSVSLFNVLILLPIQIPLITSYIVSLSIGRLIPLTLFLLWKIVLGILDPMFSHINFGIALFMSIKICWHFDKNCIKSDFFFLRELTPLLSWVFQSVNTVCLSIYLGLSCFLLSTYLGLLWLFISSAFCNFQVISSICFVRSLCKSFIFFEAIVNGPVLLILVSTCLSFVWRNVIGFCVLMLYPCWTPWFFLQRNAVMESLLRSR